jgi:acyl carrier protein
VREDRPGDKRLVAYVTPRHDPPPTVESLRAQIRDALPEHMVPSAFVVLPDMPLTPSGKLNRRALPAPDANAGVSAQCTPPQGLIEEAIASIWQELLQLSRVGRDDNFFRLGGHSLLAMQVAARVETVLGIEMPIRLLFEHPILQHLASKVESLSEQSDSPAARDDAMEELLSRVASMPESEVQELLSKFSTDETL